MGAFVLLGTTSHAVTSTAYTFQPDAGVADGNVQDPPQSWRVRVWGDVNFHVHVDSAAVDAVAASDAPVADHYNGIIVVVPAGGYLSVIKKVGEADGTCWFTRVKHG
jgi:hypothetical protein